MAESRISYRPTLRLRTKRNISEPKKYTPPQLQCPSMKARNGMCCLIELLFAEDKDYIFRIV